MVEAVYRPSGRASSVDHQEPLSFLRCLIRRELATAHYHAGSIRGFERRFRLRNVTIRTLIGNLTMLW